MIDLRELRIGNIIQPSKEWREKYPKQTAEQPYHHYVGFTDERNTDPIPITPEWLERLGFEKYDFMEVQSYKEPYCIDIHNGNTISERELFVISHGMVQIQHIYEKDITSCVFPVNVKYVHQLQNLIHAITGNELTIK